MNVTLQERNQLDQDLSAAWGALKKLEFSVVWNEERRATVDEAVGYAISTYPMEVRLSNPMPPW